MAKIGDEAFSFDDVLLEPNYSEVLPGEVDIRTRLSRNIEMNIPLVSAAMDTVTEAKTAICVARQGGVGIIHRNMSIARQALEVEKVKKSESGMIVDPITISPEEPISEVLKIMELYNISGIPVIEKGELVGIITNRDLRFENDANKQVRELMTWDNLITAKPGISTEEAKKILHQHRIEKLLIVDDKQRLQGMITVKDIEKIRKYPNACKDNLGRLRVGAALCVDKHMIKRAKALVKANVDVLLLDSAHGHSKGIIEAVKRLKRLFGDMDLIAGNVATARGTEDLIEAGVDGVKIGIGPGSICTTRIVSGVGVPQVTAIMNCVEVAEKNGIPLIADGGIKFSGDITKAIAFGAKSVMIGGLFAGSEESPGETVLFQGRRYKVYRGMGSLEAMKEGGGARYSQTGKDLTKLVPEGISGMVPHTGSLESTIYQLLGGLRSGMGYLGASNIEELRTKAKSIRVSAAGMRESHVHDVVITKEAPNYRQDK